MLQEPKVLPRQPKGISHHHRHTVLAAFTQRIQQFDAPIDLFSKINPTPKIITLILTKGFQDGKKKRQAFLYPFIFLEGETS